MSGYADDPSLTPRPPDPREIDLARAAVTPPAILLILNGLAGLVLLGLLSIPLVFDPDSLVHALKDAVAQQPPGPEKQELEQKVQHFEDALNSDREGFSRGNTIRLVLWSSPNLLAILGGLCMLRMSAYRLSVVGAAVSVIPIATGCLCTGIPLGIWALVVLLRPEIKAAFIARRDAPPPNPDEQYMR